MSVPMILLPQTVTVPDTAAGRALVGCAGWSIPRQSAAAFPEQGSHLQRFAAVFGAVEINSAFYRHHRAATYARWAATTPARFRFSVKLPRTITHEQALAEPEAVLDRFAAEVLALGDKLGCVLVQLPPKLAFDPARAAHLFAELRRRLPCVLACEARHPSWFLEDATQLLTAHGVTRVIADPPAGQAGPHVPTASTIYLRLHGAPRVYYSDYGEDFLRELGAAMAGHVAAGRQVWCIFDNTMSPTFVDQALLLQRCARQSMQGA